MKGTDSYFVLASNSYLPMKFDADFIDDGNDVANDDGAPIDNLLDADADGCFGVTVKQELIEKSEDEPEPEVSKVAAGSVKRKAKKRKK